MPLGARPKRASRNYNLLNKKWIICVTGMPGAGKTTVVNAIAELYGFHPIFAGAFLRGFVREHPNSSEAIIFQNAINNGVPAPVSVIMRLIESSMIDDDNSVYVIDGIPRNMEYCKELLKLVSHGNGINYDISLINLTILPEIALCRIQARYTCTECDSATDTIDCPLCNSVCVKRNDDLDQNTISLRLNYFLHHTITAIDEMKSMFSYIDIDASQNIDATKKQIDGFFKENSIGS